MFQQIADLPAVFKLHLNWMKWFVSSEKIEKGKAETGVALEVDLATINELIATTI